ncbi:uncharacterized protein [Canis lupus baileyi]|uniref:uncharacterized protein isoform X1 n=1 Tax=Canis lupus baileyi TaxID=143281 RepID=UPI003B97A26D
MVHQARWRASKIRNRWGSPCVRGTGTKRSGGGGGGAQRWELGAGSWARRAAGGGCGLGTATPGRGGTGRGGPTPALGSPPPRPASPPPPSGRGSPPAPARFPGLAVCVLKALEMGRTFPSQKFRTAGVAWCAHAGDSSACSSLAPSGYGGATRRGRQRPRKPRLPVASHRRRPAEQAALLRARGGDVAFPVSRDCRDCAVTRRRRGGFRNCREGAKDDGPQARRPAALAAPERIRVSPQFLQTRISLNSLESPTSAPDSMIEEIACFGDARVAQCVGRLPSPQVMISVRVLG